MTTVQDLVVIGAGPGGFAAAMRAAQLGGTVTLIEEAAYGGHCMHQACIPSKLLLTAAQQVDAIRRAGRLGILVGEPRIDLEVLHERKELIIDSLRIGMEQLLSERGVRLVAGQGRLVAADKVEVDGERIGAHNVVVATGSVPVRLPIEGADLPGVIGTEEALTLCEIPGRMAIVGSGPPEIEMAQYFQMMGSQVTLIERGRQLLPGADAELAQRLGKVLYDSGIAIKRGVAVASIRRGDDGSLVVVLADGKGEIPAERVVAARRLPNSAGLGLRQLGVETKQSAIVVDKQMRTSVAQIYAIGDVTGGLMWSHKANAEGMVAAENAMGLASRMDYASLPICLHTRPQVAWAGLTEEQAEAQGLVVRVGKVPIAISASSLISDETAGVIKIVAGRYGKILGAHIMAPGAVDLINTVSVAMLSESTVGELMRFMPAHPATGEALADAALEVERRSLHLPDW
jgi:dihydrolipoamide dehydrogenase